MRAINWKTIDWNQRTTDLAHTLGVAPSVVSYHRLKTHLRRQDRAQHRINWLDVDWSRPNFEIAKAKSASPGAVTAARKAYAPDALRIGHKVKGSYSKAHVRSNYIKKEAVSHKTVDVNVNLTSNIGVLMSDHPNIMLPHEVPTTNKTVAKPVQPSWIKRKLIEIRDWLFNVCVSVEKEANK